MFGLLFRRAPADSRREHFARWWRRYAGSIAFISLAVIAALGFARIENARYAGCVGSNLLRQGLRATEHSNIVTTQHTDLAALFPGVPPAVLEQLTQESIERAHYNIEVRYADRPCGTEINLPLTGATIVLPP